MSTISQIQEELKRINDAVFQELANAYLLYKNPECFAATAIGSVEGMQKSKSGTPDFFMILPSGKYIFAEHTTDKKRGAAKIKRDIKKCLDETKTGIPISKIDQIIICANFNISPKKTHEICESFVTTIRIFGLDHIAYEISLRHHQLASTYLGIKLSTNQVIPLNDYVSSLEQKKGLSTTLLNPFINREQEINEIISLIDTHRVVFVTGTPGSGKTRMCIEAAREIRRRDPEYTLYAIQDYDADIWNDLYTEIGDKSKSIIVIDDANRLSSIKSILGFIDQPGHEQVRLLITVRSYSKEFLQHYQRTKVGRIYELKCLNSSHIEQLVLSYRKGRGKGAIRLQSIAALANGIPRIALMIEELNQRGAFCEGITNVGQILELYFSSFIVDNRVLENSSSLKILGIVSFLHSIDLSDNVLISDITKLLCVDHVTFHQTVEALYRIELIDQKFDHIRIAEQNLSAFFFHKSVVKDKVISIEKLLQAFFNTLAYRFADVLNHIINNYGVVTISDEISIPILRYWQCIKHDEVIALRFLQVFHALIPSECLGYLHQILMNKPVQTCLEYRRRPELKLSIGANSILFELLSSFWQLPITSEVTLEIAFGLTLREPELYDDLVDSLRSNLIYTESLNSDTVNQYYIIFNFLGTEIDNDSLLARSVFVELGPLFLSYENISIRSLKLHNNNSSSSKNVDSSYFEIRGLVWKIFMTKLCVFPDIVKRFISSYFERVKPNNRNLIIFDIPYLIALFREHYRSDCFKDTKQVYDIIHRWEDYRISNAEISELIKDFTNTTHNLYMILRQDRIDAIQKHSYQEYDEFVRMKEEQIVSKILLKTSSAIDEFISEYKRIVKVLGHGFEMQDSIDIILNRLCFEDKRLGLYLIQKIVSDEALGNPPFRRTLMNQINNRVFRRDYRAILINADFNRSAHWLLHYYHKLAHDQLENDDLDIFLRIVNECVFTIWIHPRSIETLSILKPGFSKTALEAIHRNNISRKGKIIISDSLFDEYFHLLGNDREFIEDLFLSQFNLEQNYDYDAKGITNICQIDTFFIERFVKEVYFSPDPVDSPFHTIKLGSLWSISNIEAAISKVFMLDDHDPTAIGIHEDLYNSFFIGFRDDGAKTRAEQFLIALVKQHHQAPQIMNKIIQVVRNAMNGIFRDIVVCWLNHNHSVEVFKKIKWRGTYTMGSGDQILADIEKSQWHQILNIIEESVKGMQYLPIKTYINHVMAQCQSRAETERMMQFIGRW